jgi:hypothetical protein
MAKASRNHVLNERPVPGSRSGVRDDRNWVKTAAERTTG